jgi:hypothetical protein
MVPSHRRFGLAEAAALFPGDGIFGEFLHAAIGSYRNKVMAGGTPANPAALENGDYSGLASSISITGMPSTIG